MFENPNAQIIPEDAKRTSKSIAYEAERNRRIEEKKRQYNIAKDLAVVVNRPLDVINTLYQIKDQNDKIYSDEQSQKKILLKQYGNRKDLSAGVQPIEEKIINETTRTGIPGIDMVMGLRNTIASPETKEALYNNLPKPVASFVQNAVESFFMIPTDNRETKIAETFGLGYDEEENKYIVPKSTIETDTDIMFSSLQQKAADNLNREQSLFEKTMGITGYIAGVLPSFALGAGPAGILTKGIVSKLGYTGIGKLAAQTINKTPWLKWLGTGAEHVLGSATLFGISDIPASTIKAVDDIGRTPFLESFISREVDAIKSGALLGSLGFLSSYASGMVSRYIMDTGIKNPVLKVNIAETLGLTTKVMGSAGTGAILGIDGETDDMLANSMAFSMLHSGDILKQTARNIKSGKIRKDISTYNRVDMALEKPMSELDTQLINIIKNGGELTLKTLPTYVITGYKNALTRELKRSPDNKTELEQKIKLADSYIADRELGLTRPLTEQESGIIADKLVQKDITERDLKKKVTKEIWDVSYFGQLVGEGTTTTLGVVLTPLGDIAKGVVSKEQIVLNNFANIIEGAKEKGHDVLNNPFETVKLKSGKEGIMFDVIRDLISDRTGIDNKTVGTIIDKGFISLQEIQKQKESIKTIQKEIETKNNDIKTNNNDLNYTKTGENIELANIETNRRLEELSEMIWKNSDERKLFEGMSYKSTKDVVLSPNYITETPIEFIDMLQSKISIDPDKAYTDFVQSNLQTLRAKYGDIIDTKDMELRLRNVFNVWSQKVPTPLVRISLYKGKTPYPQISTTVIGGGQSSKAFSLSGPFQEIAKINGWEHVIVDNMDYTHMERQEPGTIWKPGMYEYDDFTKDFIPAKEDTKGRLYKKVKEQANIHDIIKSGASLPKFFIDLLKNDIIATGANNTKQLLSFKGNFSNYYEEGAFGDKKFYNTNVFMETGTAAGGDKGRKSISRQLGILKEYNDIFGRDELSLEQIDLNSKAEQFLSNIGIKTYQDFVDNFVINDNKTAARFKEQLLKGLDTWNKTNKQDENININDAEKLIRSAGEQILGSMVWTINNAKIFATAFGYKGENLPWYIKKMKETEFSKTFKRGSLFNKTDYAAPDNNLAMSIFSAEKPPTFVERDGRLYIKAIIGKTTNLTDRLNEKIEGTDEKWKSEYKGLSEELNWDKDKTAYDGGSHLTYGQLGIFNRMLGIDGFGGSNKNQIAIPGFAVKHAIFEFDKNDILNKKLQEKNIGLFIDKENAKILNFDTDILRGKRVWLPGEIITSDNIIEIPIDAFRIILNKNNAHRTTSGLYSVYGTLDNTNKDVINIINNNKYDIHKSVLDVIKEDADNRLKDYNALIDKLNNDPSNSIDLLLKSIDKNNLEDIELVQMFKKYPNAVKNAPELMVRMNNILSKSIDSIVSGQSVGSSPIIMPYSYEKAITGIYRMAVRDYLRTDKMNLNKEDTKILWEDIERQTQEYRDGTKKNPEIENHVKQIIKESFDGRVLKEGYGIIGQEIADIHKINSTNNKMITTVIPTEVFINMQATKIIGIDKGNNTFMVTPRIKMGAEGKDNDGDANYCIKVDSDNKNKLWDILWESKDKVADYYKDYRKYDINNIGVTEFQKNMESIGLKNDLSLTKYRNIISSPFSVFHTVRTFVDNRIGEVTNASKIINTILHAGLEKKYPLIIGDKTIGTVTYGKNEQSLELLNKYLGSLKTAMVDPKNGHIGTVFSQNDLIIKALEGKIDIDNNTVVTPEQLNKALDKTRQQFTTFYQSITKPVTTLTYGKLEGKTLNINNQKELVTHAKEILKEYPALNNTPLYQTLRDIDENRIFSTFDPFIADNIRNSTYTGLEGKYGKVNSKIRTFLEAGLSGKISDVDVPELYDYLLTQNPMRDFKPDYLQYISTLKPQRIGTNKYNLLETKPTLQYSSIALSQNILGSFRNYISDSKELKTSIGSHKYSMVIVPADPKLLLRLGVDKNKIDNLVNSANIVGVITDESGKVYTRSDSELYQIGPDGKSPYSTFFGDRTKLQYNKQDITIGRRRLQLLENIMFSSVTPETKQHDIELLLKEGINGITLSEDGKKRAIVSILDPKMFVPKYRLDNIERDIQNINKYGTNIDLGPKIVNKLMPDILDEFYTSMDNIAKSPDKVTEIADKPVIEYDNIVTDIKVEIGKGINEANKEIKKINSQINAFDPNYIAAMAMFVGIGIPLLKGVYRGTVLGLTAINNARELKKEYSKNKAEKEELINMLNNDWTKNRDVIINKISTLEKERGTEIYGLSWLKDMVNSPSFIKTMEDMSPENKYNRISQWMGIVDFIQAYKKTMKPLKLKDDFMAKMLTNYTEPVFVAQYFGNKTTISNSDDKFITIRDFLTGSPLTMTYGHLAKWLTLRPGGNITTTSTAEQAMVDFNMRLEQVKSMGNLGEGIINMIHRESGKDVDYNIVTDLMSSIELKNISYTENGDMVITDKNGKDTEFIITPWAKNSGLISRVASTKKPTDDMKKGLEKALEKFVTEYGETFAKRYSGLNEKEESVGIEKVKSAMRTVLLLQQYNRWYIPKYLNGFKNMLIDIDNDFREKFGDGIGQLELGKDIANQIRQIDNQLLDLKDNSTFTPFVPLIFKTEKHREKFKTKIKDIMTEEYIYAGQLDPRKPEDMAKIDNKLGELTFHNYMWLEKDKDGNLWQDNDIIINNEQSTQKNRIMLNGFQKRGLLKGIIKGKYGIDIESIIATKRELGIPLTDKEKNILDKMIDEERDIFDKVLSETTQELKDDKTIKENNKYNIWGAHTYGYSYEFAGNNLLPLKLRGTRLDDFFKGDYGNYKGPDMYNKWHKSFEESLRLRTANMLFKLYDNKMKQLNENPFARKAVIDAFRYETSTGYGFYNKTSGTKLNIGDIIQIDAKNIEMPFSTKKDIIISDENDSFVHGITKEPGTVDWISGVVVGKENGTLKIRDYLNDNTIFEVPANRTAYKAQSASNLTGFADTLAKMLTIDKTDINKRVNRSEAILKIPELALDLLNRLGVAGAIGGPSMPRFAANNIASLDLIRLGGIKSVIKYIGNTPFFVKSLLDENAIPSGSKIKQDAYIGLGNKQNITFFQTMTDLIKSDEGIKKDIKKLLMTKQERERLGEVSFSKSLGESGINFLRQLTFLWHGAGLQQRQETAVRKYIGADAIERSYIIKDGEITELSKSTNQIDEVLDWIAAMTAITSAQSEYGALGRPPAANTKFGRTWNMFLPYRSGKIAGIFRELQESSKLSLYKTIDKEFFDGKNVVMPDMNGNLRQYNNWNKSLKRHATEYAALGAMNMVKSYIKQGLMYSVGNALLGSIGLVNSNKKIWDDFSYYFGWSYSVMDSFGRLMGDTFGESAQSIMEGIDNNYLQSGNKRQFAQQRTRDGKLKTDMEIESDKEVIRRFSMGLGQSYFTENAFLLGVMLNSGRKESDFVEKNISGPRNHVFLKAPMIIYDMLRGKPARSLPNPVELINPFRTNRTDKDYLDKLMENRNPKTRKDIREKKREEERKR